MADKPESQAAEAGGAAKSPAPSQNPWFTPRNALSDEQIEALNAVELPNLDTQLLIGADPSQTGGWFVPEAVREQVASQLIDEAFVASLQPASVITEQLLEAPEPEITELDAEVLPAPDAPIAFGQADFVDAPQGPVADENAVLGGLRVQQPAGLDPSQLRAEQTVAPEVPQRGLGGVRGGYTTSPEETRILSDTGHTPTINRTGPFSPQGPGPNLPDPQAQRFQAVEQTVNGLRQQYAQGLITRSQLEGELRKHIIMDNQGRWWTIGVDSNRWYRYDGREWIPDTPPQTGPAPGVIASAGVVTGATGLSGIGPQQPAQGSYVPTETNVQMPVSDEPGRAIPQIELDEYGMPLPAKVPTEDLGATMVNLRSATSSNAETTWAPTVRSGAVQSGEDVVSSPLSGVTVPSMSVNPAEAATLIGDVVTDEGYEGVESPEAPNTGISKKIGIQPDYSEAYNRSFDRSDAVRIGVWASVLTVVISLAVVFCVLLGMVAYYFSVVNQYSDRIDNLGQRASAFQTTRIYDVNGNIIAEYNDPNRGARTEVPLEEISPFLIHATIATEDESYYENPGFSVFAITRAIFTNLTSQGPRSGASTITQQLVRALLLDEGFATEVSSERKITEIILAAELNRKYTKNEILEIYLNEIYYGNLAYGIEAAAQFYFNTSASNLNVYQAAFLAGLPQAPATYDPLRDREVALGRMDTVLRLMTEANGDGCIQMEHQNSQFDLSVPFCVTVDYLNPQLNPDRSLELALVETQRFGASSNDPRFAHYVNWIWTQLESQYDPTEIYERGFSVYTTLDPEVQQVALQAINEQLQTARNQGFTVNNGSVVVMDPRTGAVTAMVGSADFNNEGIRGQVNVALTPQQPGSAIKPLVYLTAFEGTPDGTYFTPATVLWDTPSCWGNYCPPNFDGEFRGPVSVRQALANSLNVPAVKTMNTINPSYFEQRAQELGLRFPEVVPSQVGLPSGLGAVEVRLFDLTATYSVFANGGQRFQPYGISRIVTADGTTIFEHTPVLEGTNINPAHAYLINNILSDAQARSAEFGSAPLMQVPGREVAVKTGTSGTSTDTFDALTIGWTPQVIVGVWMGNTDNSPLNDATGFRIAVPVWNRVINTALQGEPVIPFPRPNTIVGQNVCRDTGAIPPATGCGVGGMAAEFFYTNQPPPPASEGLIEVVLVDPFTNLRANQFCSDYAVQKSFLKIDDGTAIQWLQTAGQTWAQQRGIDPNNIQEPPVGECTADQPRPQVVISQPAEGAVVSNLIPVFGTATVPNFAYYELQYATLDQSNNFITIERRNIEQIQANSFLGEWDMTTLPNGPYILRLVVVSNTGAQAEVKRAVSIVNQLTPSINPTPGTEAVPPGQSG